MITLSSNDERRGTDGFGEREISIVGAPDDFAVVGIKREDLTVERAVEDLAVSVGEAAGLRSAAGGFDRRVHLRHLGPEFPFDDAVAREIERIDVVGLRRGDVHRIADNER